METVTERSSVPPPLPPKTRKSITITNGAPPTVKTTVYGGDVVVNGFSEAGTSITNDNHHVVKIRINPTQDETFPAAQRPGNVQQHPSAPVLASFKQLEATRSLTFQPSFSTTTSDGCIRISVSNNDVEPQEDMVRNTTSIPSTFIKTTPERGNPYFFYSPFPSNVMSSGQSSPSDTLDSGTCSDLDGSTPPPLPKKKSATSITSQATVTVIVNGNTGAHRRTGSLTSSGAEVDSDDDEGSNISCDSLNSSDLNAASNACSISNGGEVSIPEEDEEVDIVQTVNTTKIKSDIVEAVNTAFVEQHKEKEDIIAQKSLFLASIINPPPLKPVQKKPPTPPAVPPKTFTSGLTLPEGLLQDIRDRTAKLTVVPSPCSTLKRKTRTWADDVVAKSHTNRSPVSTIKLEAPRNGVEESAEKKYPSPPSSIVEEKTYEERKKETEEKKHQEQLLNELFPKKPSMVYDTDRFYKFHLNEHINGSDNANAAPRGEVEEIETFAGVRDYMHEKEPSSTIRSAKGTVRGVKNRVRAGIATFLQMQNNKNYKEKEAGKVVVYTTTMGVVRETYQDCVLVKKILRNLMVKYEERDVFMSRDTQTEIRERMGCDEIVVPQLFVEGQHIGNAETVERLNESGELRRILKPFKSADAVSTCQVCGGYRLLPCSICNGSKKSVHRNHFTAEFVALKCMHCDEVGLVRCHAC